MLSIGLCNAILHTRHNPTISANMLEKLKLAFRRSGSLNDTGSPVHAKQIHVQPVDNLPETEVRLGP